MKTLYALYKDVIKGLDEYKEAQEKRNFYKIKLILMKMREFNILKKRFKDF